MPTKDGIVHVSAASEVKSIQIIINLGQPTETGPEPPSEAPKGAFIRQVFPGPDNATMKIRTSFVPDDLTQDTSIQISDPDPGELAKWKQLLGDPENIDIDAGDIIMRVNEQGGTVTWLPENMNQDPIIHRFQPRTEGEPGGATIGEFIQCWNDRGQTAAAASSCWSRL